MTGSSRSRSGLISDQLRQRLRRFQVVAQSAATQGGVGDRRSRSKGEGIEFEDFRDYVFGDDMRRVDPHVFARLGQPVIRQYNVSERLSITLLVDLSASMDFGSPPKAEVARALAAGLSLCSLAHGDAVHCGVFDGANLDWYPRLTGYARFGDLEAWLVDRPTGATKGTSRPLHLHRTALPAGGIGVLISDLWGDDVLRWIDTMKEAGHELIVIRVLAPEELDPERLGSRSARFVDSESGEEVEVDLVPATVASYREHMRARTQEISDLVLEREGRFVDVSSDTPLTELFERRLREHQVIR